MPLTISGLQYHIAVSLHQQDDFVLAPTSMPHKKKSKVGRKPK